MFKNFGSWLGIEKENGQVEEEGDSKAVVVVDANQDANPGMNNPTPAAGSEQSSDKDVQLLQKAKGFSGYFFNIASNASKKISESVIETAQTFKKSVEEGKINGIIDKTILGDFQKEQAKFVQEKKAKQFGAAVPPWVGYNEEETIQQQILALSADKRNFLRDPPAGVQFHYDFEQMYPVAMVMLEEDELLRKMRFHLVPKQVKEELFWKNYFYRVSLIKQSAQLTALAAQQAAERRDVSKSGSRPEEVHQKDPVKRKITTAAISSSKPKPNEDEEEISTSPTASEFVSDAFDSCKINEDDIRKEIEQLVLDKKEHPNTQQETADWERELQEELQEYDVLPDTENCDENWDKEIEAMLKEDS